MNASPCAIKILCALWNQSIYLKFSGRFISADSSPLMAGVNIVSPEDGATSMKITGCIW
jgi:hypothetical protein